MSHSRPSTSLALPMGRRIVEVVIPARKHTLHIIDDEDERPQMPKHNPSRPVKRTRVRHLSNDDDDEDYSPGPDVGPILASPMRATRRSRRARSISSSTAGPSGDSFRGNTPSTCTSGPMSASGSSSSSTHNDRLQSLARAVDYLTDPDAIMVEAGDDLRMVISTSPPPETRPQEESGSTSDIDPVHYQINMDKLNSPEPEDLEMDDPEIDCAICYESLGDVCRRAEEEGKGGIGGGLAIFACEQPACGGIFCLSCIVAAANNNIRNRKEVACPLCTRPTEISAIRNQAVAYDPNDASDPIVAPPPLPRPQPARAIPANQHLRDQHVHCVVAFHLAIRPGQRYFVNSFEEFVEYLKLVHPAAAQTNPVAHRWFATSAWEAFWCTYQGRSWRGLPRLRVNSFLMTIIKGLDIRSPAEHGMTRHQAIIQALDAADPTRWGPGDEAERDIEDRVDGRVRRGRQEPMFPMAQIRARAREARAIRIAAQDPDQVRADLALLGFHLPAMPPPELAGPEFTPLGIDRPAVIHHRNGFDLMLQEHRSEAARRGWMRMMFALQTDREADILYANMRRIYNLDMVNPEVQPTEAELERMQVMRHAWALINEGRQALMAAQAHQLPVAMFDLPEIVAPVPAPEAAVDVVE